MISKLLVKLFLIALLAACNQESKVNDMQIKNLVVKTGFHEKIDLEKETYTVYFMNLTSQDHKFTLTDKEKSDIIKMAQDCGLTQLKGHVRMNGNCDMFPVVMTEMWFDAGNNQVQVSTDGCENNSKVEKFLVFLHKMIYAKPEVKKAPQTDIHYM